MAAKWAAWQHITKISDRATKREIYLPLRERKQLSNALLGKFLNGTLFNIASAAVGFSVAWVIKNTIKADEFSELSLRDILCLRLDYDALLEVIAALPGVGLPYWIIAASLVLTAGVLWFWYDFLRQAGS